LRRMSPSPKSTWASHLAPIHLTESGVGLLDWVFLPYVFPNEEAESRLRSMLRRRLTVPPVGPAAFRSWILDKLRSPEKRAELRDCMEDAGIRHNYMSMSLYSGPTTLYTPEISLYTGPGNFDFCENDRCGWLGTGDSELGSRIAWERFHAHYRQVMTRVQTLAIPHHGSERNFNPSLLRLGAEHFVVTSRTRSRHHPAAAIKKQLEAAGRYHHVNQMPNSMLAQQFLRAV
jgi:hypothetical protein